MTVLKLKYFRLFAQKNKQMKSNKTQSTTNLNKKKHHKNRRYQKNVCLLQFLQHSRMNQKNGIARQNTLIKAITNNEDKIIYLQI